MSAVLTEEIQVPAPRRAPIGGYLLLALGLFSPCLILVDATPFPIRLAAGLSLMFVLPVLLVNAKMSWPGSVKLLESLLYSIGIVVLALILLGLALNEILPVLGVDRPLDRLPVVVGLSFAVGGLALWRRDRWRVDSRSSGQWAFAQRSLLPQIAGRDQVLYLVGITTVVGAVAGAVRLNNGGGGAVTLSMLVIAAVLIVLLFAWRDAVRESSIVVTIYLIALALLLMTSLRGWFVTGHDIQREFRVFELAAQSGIWRIDAFRDAYNACLSVTILPTLIERATGIPSLFVYKLVFQALYALCPVIIYLLSRRAGTKAIALLAATYFIAFPTYFTDMPFLNRQEIAFLFMALALLVATDQGMSLRTRRIMFLAFGIGIVLSHYSTTYVLLAILAFAWIITRARTIVGWLPARWAANRRRDGRRISIQRQPLVANGFVIVALALATLTWVGPLTGTGGQLKETFTATAGSLKGFATGQRSSEVSYTIFGGAKPDPEERLADYREESENVAEDREQRYSPAEVARYQTPVREPPSMPVTALGSSVEESGVKVSTINHVLRGGAPVMLQLFVGLGVLAVVVGWARGFRPSPEYLAGAIGSVAAVSLHVLLPNVSVDYGVLRTFAQGLFWLAPFLAVGSVQAFAWLGQSRAVKAATGLAVLFFVSLTGVVSQLLGGYPAQLHLNNSGQYYDIYYLHPQEISSIEWLQSRVSQDAGTAIQSEVATDRYAIKRLQNYTDVVSSDDIFPTRVRKDAYVYLGYAAVRQSEVTLYYRGDLVTYKYPMEFLDNNKSLIFSSDGSEVYR